MSYERMREYTQQSKCACGRGIVVRTYYSEMDDWNRIRDGYENEEIRCETCKDKYHIESTTRTYSCPSWKGSGIVTNYFLIPNGKTLHLTCKTTREFNYCFKNNCVSDYTLENLKAVISDMKTSKYSTRLLLDNSKEIVKKYQQFYKKKSLPAIIEVLQECVDNYNSFEWAYEKTQEYNKKLQQEIDENQKIINDTLAESYPLEFK